MTGMSVAAFYRHFRAVTAISPDPVPEKASTPESVATVHIRASRFSREYARIYGLPPVPNAARFRTLESQRIASIPSIENSELA